MKLILAFVLLSTALTAQLTLEVNQFPASTPTDATLYLAGNFNGWDPEDADFQLTEANGTYSITIDPDPGALEFKFTRGGWATVEGTAAGAPTGNRMYDYDGSAQTATFTIAGWEDLDGSGGGGGSSTAAVNVSVLDDDFYLPQLNRNRRIWLYLPPDYDDQTAKHYPVIYMHDGQNLFDAATSFSGEWQVDETLNDLHASGDYGAIVVGIDNGGGHRIDEYSPWTNPQYGGGEGAAYIDFIVETLKPHIDQNYRTRPEREFTAIAGSSMGGLISQYAVMAHPETFGKAGILSPSFWFSGEVYVQASQVDYTQPVRLYYLASQNEDGGSVVADIVAMGNQLGAGGYTEGTDYTVVATDYGAHSEWYWAGEFAAVYEWLFAETTFVSTSAAALPELRIYPNPAGSTVSLHGTFNGSNEVRIYDLNGHLIQTQTAAHQIEVGGLPMGTYLLELRRKGRPVARGRLIRS